MANRMNVLLTFVRFHKAYPRVWRKDAVQYDCVKYHPRVENHMDPPIVPSKVLMIHRVKPFKGNPWWEKNVLTQLGFEEKKNEPVFVKNTPEMCGLLWRVKHLVKIVPVKIPENLSKLDDSTEFFFHEDGTCYVSGKVDPYRKEATESAQNSIKRLQNSTISEKLRLQWEKGLLI
ncbi:mitochondrial ribosomal protein L30 [Calliopsis andreniformis]|uniref:mitochondrial ribosomal protein L30 n=1 Tax=Calliopsis andreniformis TaxID=337506 RepID=UPI003FCDF3E6